MDDTGFHNILVGIDGSAASERALERAIAVASASRARLTILTAIQRMPLMIGASGDPGAVAQLMVDLERQALERLEEAVERVPADVPVTKIVSRKPVREALLARVATGCHDLVVLGTRGRTGLRALLAPGISGHVVARCAVPVLVVHADWPERSTARPSAPPHRTPLAHPKELLT